MYTLRQGRMSAVVEGADWSTDGRWLAIGTRKRTVHVFAVNPYGGQTDIASHLEGRVKNVDVIVCCYLFFENCYLIFFLEPSFNGACTFNQTTTELCVRPNAPLAFTFDLLISRTLLVFSLTHASIRQPPPSLIRQSSASDHPNAPLAFTFISPLDISHSPRLLPHPHIHSPTAALPHATRRLERISD